MAGSVFIVPTSTMHVSFITECKLIFLQYQYENEKKDCLLELILRLLINALFIVSKNLLSFSKKTLSPLED